ncbi:MAG: ATP-NAD kinase family protein [Sulfolobales archaeon]
MIEERNSLKICFFINPVAGLGGEAGLKGSDYIDISKVLQEGYRLVSYEKAERFFKALDIEYSHNIELIVPQDPMGCSVASKYRTKFKSVYCENLETPLVNQLTTRAHTMEFIRKYIHKCDLLIFVGGDGTARDVLETLSSIEAENKIILGIPAGVKVYSGVFARSPETASRILSYYMNHVMEPVKRPVIDADENELRKGSLVIRNYGELTTLYIEELIQETKSSYSTYKDFDYEGVARYLDEIFSERIDRLFIVGPGSTLKKVFEYLYIDKTPYGVDAIYMRKLIGKDLSRKDIDELIRKYEKINIILTPIPGTRFLIGRGNQQISADVYRRIDKKDLIVITSLSKLSGKNTVYIDTGDPEVDNKLSGYIRAIVGYREEILIKLVPAREI